jgi:radical SAM protein with 4Fe4S-binding SPASM domain
MKAKNISKLNLDNRTPLQDVIPLETPFLLYVDPSSACNFRCRFCPSGHQDLIAGSTYKRGTMNFELFTKVIADLQEFDRPIKVLRMNKIGEPFLNRKLPQMVSLAKRSGRVEYIDLATNGSLFTVESLAEIIDAGLDRMNISLEGVNRLQYLEHAGTDIDFEALVAKLRWLHAHKGDCEITIKVPGNYLSEGDKKEFLAAFGDCCDRIFVEDLAPIWPGFDVEERAHTKVAAEKGQYQQPLEQKDVCTYIFYAAAVNADGTVSACCPDWDQQLIVGDVREESLKKIWASPAFNALRRQHLEGLRCANTVCSRCGHIKYAQVDNIDPYREVLLEKLQQLEEHTGHAR